MQRSRSTLLAVAVAAMAAVGCQTQKQASNGAAEETSTGLPYRPPGVARYVEPPDGFDAPMPGEPLTERRYLPPSPELEPLPISRGSPVSVRGGVVTTRSSPPFLTSRNQAAIQLAIPQNDWVQAASRWQGVPYREGGTTREGIDDSGLVQQLYKEVLKRDVPRTAAEQWDRSISSGSGPVQPGDVVFFSTRKILGDETTHVGVVVGNRVFVHVSSSMGVSYGSLDDAYWNKRFTGARRFDK